MTKSYTAVETAKLIREALKVFKADYPNVKFSVKQSGSISWVDGPTQAEVKAVVGHFHCATFDGMYDLETTFTQTDENGEEVRYGIKYLSFNRRYTVEFLQRAIAAQGTHCYQNNEKVTPDYEIIYSEGRLGAYIKMNGTFYRSGGTTNYVHRWENQVMEWAQKNSDTYDYEAEEARKRAEWEKEYEAQQALYAEIDAQEETPVIETVIIPVVIEEDEPAQVMTEQTPIIEIPDNAEKGDLFYAKLLTHRWHDQPLEPKPSGEIDTPYGKALLTVNDDYSVSVDVLEFATVNTVLYKIQGTLYLRSDTEEWWFANHTSRVVKGEYSFRPYELKGYPTDNARKAINDALTPLVEQWLEKNYEKLSMGRLIGDKNRIERARHKIISLQQELALRAKYLEIVEQELTEKGRLTQTDKDNLDVYGRYWRFG